MAKYIILLMVIAFGLIGAPVLAQEGTGGGLPVVVIPEAYDRGVDFFDAEEYESAILNFSLFLLLNPTSSQAYYATALSYLSMEDYDGALTSLDRALAIQPLDPVIAIELYRTRADINRVQENYEDAIRDYSFVLDLDPTADDYFRRALLYATQEEYDLAVADIDSAVNLQDDNPTFYVYRGFINTLNGDTNAAAEDYNAFVGLIETDRVEADLLESGQLEGVRLAPGIVYSFPVKAEAGFYLSAIAATADETMPIDTLLILLDEDGAAIIADDDGGGSGIAIIRDFQIQKTGDYTLLVANSLGGGSGAVVVQMFLTPDPFTAN